MQELVPLGSSKCVPQRPSPRLSAGEGDVLADAWGMAEPDAQPAELIESQANSSQSSFRILPLSCAGILVHSRLPITMKVQAALQFWWEHWAKRNQKRQVSIARAGCSTPLTSKLAACFPGCQLCNGLRPAGQMKQQIW